MATKKQTKNKNKKNIKKYDLGFLNALLNKLIAIKNYYDTRSNVILIISIVIFFISIDSILNDQSKGIIGFLIISFSSLFSAILCLYSLITPSLLQKSKGKKSLLNPDTISLISQNTAIKKLTEISTDKNLLKEHYLREIYNISKNQIMIKKKLNKQASIILIWGIVLGFILMLFMP